MSVPSATTEEIFPGTGAQTAFVYTQNTPAAADVKVAILDPSGAPTLLTNVTHYDLAGVGGSGGITVTYPRASAPIAPFDVTLLGTEKIVIWVDPARTTDFNPKNNAVYGPVALGARIDAMYRNMQKMQTDLDRTYHVALGAPNPAAVATAPSVTGGRFLLDTTTVANAAKITVTAANWPATYDRVELELDIVPLTDDSDMEIQPLDGLVATVASLRSTHKVAFSASINVNVDTIWRINTVAGVGDQADERLVGMARFFYVNAGFLYGTGEWTSLRGSDIAHINSGYVREAVATNSWDGFDILFSAGNITGKAKLWGIYNS